MLRTGHKADKLRVADNLKLHRGAEPTRHSGAERHASNDLSSPCSGCCSRWDRWRNGNGKSDGNRRILLPSQRSGKRWGFGTSNTWGSRSRHRATRIPIGSKGRTAHFRSSAGDERLFKGTRKVWMLNFRVRDTSRWNRGQDGPAVLS
jgi:hypothetical protein